MRSKLAVFLMLVFIIPMITPTELSPIGEASAASNCDGGEFVNTNWNKTVERHAKIPTVKDVDNEYTEDGKRRRDNDKGDDESEEAIEYDGPEDAWMTYGINNDLSLLRDDFDTTMLIGNDAVGTLRVNLDHERRTTVCVTIFEYSENETNSEYIPANADVYLMTTTQYDRYTAAYDVDHGQWGGRGYEAELSDIAPEWRSFNVAGWQTFRDSHQYEDVKEISFSVSLDGPEISSGLFGGETNQYFNIVIDNTNNSHSGDALPKSAISAKVSVVSEERSTILPNWTVSLVCCGLMIATIVLPVLMNKRYMEAGLSLTSENQQLDKGLVPSLEQTGPD
jgi:hypothetical protein